MKIKISKGIRDRILARDKFTCQKCELIDKSGKKLEIHHIKPLYSGGTNKEDNLITLCNTCHCYAPNKSEEFSEYPSFKMDGMSDLILKSFRKFIAENPELQLKL